MAASGDDIFRQAFASFQAGKLAGAERQFKAVLAAQPNHVAALNLLSMVLTQRQRYAEAEPYIKRAIELNSRSDASFYNYALILKALDRPGEAHERLSQALALNPNVADTWNNRGVVANDLKRYGEAIADLDRAIKLRPNYPEAFCNKGKSLAGLERHAEALAAYDAALALKPDLVEAWLGRGNIFRSLKRYDDALAAYDRMLAVDPGLADAWLGRGNTFAALKQESSALSSYDEAVRLKPDLAEAWVGRGNVYCEMRDFEEAYSAYERALALKPDLAEAWLGRGNVLCETRRFEDAKSAYNRSLTLRPSFTEAWLSLGNASLGLKRPTDALPAYERALTLDPNFAQAWFGRGIACRELKQFAEVYSSFDRAFAAHPDLPGLEGARLHSKMHLCDWNDLDADCARLLAAIRGGKPNAAPFDLLSLESTPSDQLQCAKLWVAKEKISACEPMSRGEGARNDRICVAYVSQDLLRHPVGEAIVSVLENHDRSRFEVVGISLGPDDGSAARARIVRAVDQFHDVRTKNDVDVAALIRDIGVDIAVKLAPHTDGSRLGILARRPAPIQVSGSSAWTSGADFLDYVLADPRALPFDQQPHFSERIVHLPDSFFPHDSTPEISSHAPSRSEVGLPERAFVFCCFNRSYKLNPRIFDVWMRILKRVDGAVLWLTHGNDQATNNLRREARARDVDPSRLIFASPTPLLSDHLARHRLADLFLDTLPYGAHTTAIDALYAGLPVLTCLGSTFVGRVSASQLHAAGLDDLAADTLENYEELAVRFAENPDELQAVRDRLASNRLTHPLFDTTRLCRHMEAAYTEMMVRHRRGEPPAPFAVIAID